MKIDKDKRWWVNILYTLVILIATICLPSLSALSLNFSYDKMIQLIITCLIGSCFIIFEYFYESDSCFNVMNQPIKPWYFLIIYSITMLIISFFPFLPARSWPFLFLALLFCIFSSTLMSLLSFSLSLMICVLLKESNLNVFLLYFFCGLIVIILFHKIDKNYKIGIPIFISLCTYLVFSTIDITLFTDTTIGFEAFFLPIVNIFLNLVLMVIVLKLYSSLFIHKYRERYMTINDTEFIVLSEVKKTNSKAYYKAIHTSYLTDKIATKFNLDQDKIKTASYYWKIYENLNLNDQKVFFNKITNDYKFPPESLELIKELMNGTVHLHSKEAIAVYMSNEIIDVVTAVFQKDKDAKIQYKQVFEKLFSEKREKGFFDRCDYTMYELKKMNKIFVEEALYYDFLR